MAPPKQRSAAWVEERRHGIGASDIPVLAGLTTWSSPTQVYLEKRGEIPPPEETEAMARGNLLEEPVARWWSARTGLRVRQRHEILHHPVHDWARASLDREVVGRREILEVKTTSDRWEEPPEAVHAQVQWQLGVTGAERAHVAALTGGLELGRWEILPDPAYFEDLLVIGEVAWRGIQAGIPPALDGSEATRRALARFHPRETAPMLPADDTFTHLAELLFAAEADARYTEERLDTLRNAFRAGLGEAEGVEGPGWKVTWRRNRDGTKVEWEAVARELALTLALRGDGDALEEAIRDHSEIRPGARVLRTSFEPGWAPALGPGAVELPTLDAGPELSAPVLVSE